MSHISIHFKEPDESNYNLNQSILFHYIQISIMNIFNHLCMMFAAFGNEATSGLECILSLVSSTNITCKSLPIELVMLPIAWYLSTTYLSFLLLSLFLECIIKYAISNFNWFIELSKSSSKNASYQIHEVSLH